MLTEFESGILATELGSLSSPDKQPISRAAGRAVLREICTGFRLRNLQHSDESALLRGFPVSKALESSSQPVVSPAAALKMLKAFLLRILAAYTNDVNRGQASRPVGVLGTGNASQSNRSPKPTAACSGSDGDPVSATEPSGASCRA